MILRVLRCIYGGIPNLELTGMMDAPTVAALRRFQTFSGLEPTGILDKVTWRQLARHYTMAAGDGRMERPCK